MRSKRPSSKRVWRDPDDALSFDRAWFEDAEATVGRDGSKTAIERKSSRRLARLGGMQLNSAIGHIKAGKLRALAVTSDKRMAELPDVPNMLDKEDKLVVPMIKKLGIKTE